MEKLRPGVDFTSVTNGRLEIIVKSKVYRFSGSYSIRIDEGSIAGLPQFDVLFSIDDENYLVHPSDVDRVVSFLKTILPGQQTLTARLIRRGGALCILSGEGLVVAIEPDAVENLIQLRKTEELLLSNYKLLKQAEEIAVMGSWEFNYSSKRFLWSEGMYRIFGISYPQAVVPEVYLEYAIDEDKSIAREIITSFRNEPFPFNRTLRIRAEDKIKTINVKSRVINGEDGKPETLLGFDVDVSTALNSETALTEQRQLQSDLEEVNAKLRTLDELKTKFFSDVSHELRTPLTLVINPLGEIIQKDDRQLTEEEFAQLEMAHRNGLRLQKLVNTLLDFFRIESGKMQARFEETNLSDLTVDIASNFRSAIEAAGLKFTVKKLFPPQMAFVDKDFWEKIVANLVSNAFKFTHKGSIRVSIVANRGMLQLRVRDTGIGISEEDIPKLFQRFVRVEGAKARTHEGSGIGLALVKELVMMHGGTIDVESEPGKGSEFIVSIPRGRDHLKHVMEGSDNVISGAAYSSYVQEMKAWLPERRNDAWAGLGTLGPDEKPSVMIVDDNADMREYLLHTLTSHFVIIPAENGAQALRFLGNVRPDLILTDMMMPEVDGKTLLTELRKTSAYSNIPVVLLSARSGENIKSEAIQLGADDYISKPFSVRELIAILSARIQISRMRMQTEREIGKKQLELEQMVMQRTKELVRSREDVTLANEMLKQKNYELMAMNEELTNFAFIASHDLREPLRKVTLFSNELSGLAKQSMLPEKAREYAEKIFNSVIRMNALLDDVLNFSRMRSRSQLKYTKVNLSKVIEEVVTELSELIKDNEAVIKVNELPTITGNAVQIYHLFENLISNAVKFHSSDHGSTIRIQSEALKKNDPRLPFPGADSEFLRVVISDDGIGFEQQYAERIFHMFQKLHRSNEYSGTGMGLAICRKVMQNHRGHIFAEGKPGEGATFTCYFPMAYDNAERAL